MLKEGRSKHEAISHILENPDMDFYWSVITDGLRSDYSSQLLHEIATLWFTIRGFSVASRLLEDYKHATKKI